MNIQWHLRRDTQTCEWTFRLAEAEFKTTMTMEEFFNLVKALNQTCLSISQNMLGDMNVTDALNEVDKLLKAGQKKNRLLLTVAGQLIGELDKDYEVVGGQVVFDEVLLKGIWPPPNNELVFNGVKLHVESVVNHTGLLVDEKGARGPVIQGVKCKVEVKE